MNELVNFCASLALRSMNEYSFNKYVADGFVFLNGKVKQRRLLSELHLIVNNTKDFSAALMNSSQILEDHVLRAFWVLGVCCPPWDGQRHHTLRSLTCILTFSLLLS